MKCWCCNTELIWGGDFSGEDYGNKEYEIVSNLSCPNCKAYVEVYHQKIDKTKEEKNATTPREITRL